MQIHPFFAHQYFIERKLTGYLEAARLLRCPLKQQGYALPISYIVLDLLSVFFYITATRIFTALSTFQIVGGIKGLA